MNDYYGVIDLGTNTFHLLLAHNQNGKINIAYKERHFVKLFSESTQFIGEMPFTRALDAIRSFKTAVKSFPVKKLALLATEGLRSAENSSDLIRAIHQISGWDVTTIPGEIEAQLIFEGIRQYFDSDGSVELVMDIGGGSTEFIIGKHNEIIWLGSYKTGVAVLYDRYRVTGPVDETMVKQIQSDLKGQLEEVIHSIQTIKPTRLVGTSGSFETFDDLLKVQVNTNPYHVINRQVWQKLFELMTQSSLEERLSMEGVAPERAELMPVGTILVDLILKSSGIDEVKYSPYAMKEGAVACLMGINKTPVNLPL